ncbi:MAG TPA: sigma-70 family RNA polymerase sigma factor [Chloroflexia bacterium]|nr:sigma-70 family RNA polymerase sigma factor [Chloroflexia bacterium]
MQEDSEDKIVSDAQRGDLPAFNLLVTKHEQRVYNLAYRMLNDAEAAADATQDAFFQAYRALGQYRGGSFKSWLLRIASNICYDRLRARQRRPTTSLEALIEDAEEVGGSDLALLEDPQGDPIDHATRRELARELASALQSLPEEQRLVVILSDVQGMSYDEIVYITGASLGTVKSRISRGRLKIREYLQKSRELLPGDFRQ